MRISPSGYHQATAPADLMVLVDRTAAAIKAWVAENGPITHIACRGTSGQSVAWPVSYKLGIPVLVVRKPGEKAHSGELVGQGELGRYVIVDDFIASGATIDGMKGAIARAYNAMGHMRGTRPECVAIFLYASFRTRAHDGVPVIGNPEGDF